MAPVPLGPLPRKTGSRGEIVTLPTATVGWGEIPHHGLTSHGLGTGLRYSLLRGPSGVTQRGLMLWHELEELKSLGLSQGRRPKWAWSHLAVSGGWFPLGSSGRRWLRAGPEDAPPAHACIPGFRVQDVLGSGSPRARSIGG